MENASILISIVVPLYNSEKYICRCIESIIRQNYNNWELIIVNDGSTDNSPSICNSYAYKDKRIKVIHKTNEGIAKTRLRAYKEISGEYVIFCDSDDYLLPNSISLLYNSIKKGYDIVRSPVFREDGNGRTWFEQYKTQTGEIIGTNSFLKELILNNIAPYLHSAIFKSSIFSQDCFLPAAQYDINIGEDWMAMYLSGKNVKSVGFIDSPTYVYCINEGSVMKTSIRSFCYFRKINDALSSYNKNLPEELKELSLYSSCLSKLHMFFIPELGFDFGYYKEIEKNIDQAMIYMNGLQHINKKEIIFIHSLPFFWFYSRLYCLYFWARYRHFKLKKVLY